MDIRLERILMLIPTDEDGKFIRGEKKKFCDKLGIPTQKLTDWIAGRSTTYIDMLYEISAKFDVSVEWLKGETDVKQQNRIFSIPQSEIFPEDAVRRITESVVEQLMQTEKPATETGNGLSEDELDLIRLYRSSQPHIRKAMLDLLRSAEAGQSTPDASGANR